MIIAFCLTCYNRSEKTVSCLEMLTKISTDNTENKYRIYVCDDCSSDGTPELVKERFPHVVLIESSGNLYWCRGMYEVMRRAYNETADLYIMINDDVEFFPDMVKTMLTSYYQADEPCGIVGTTLSKISGVATYGGRVKYGTQSLIEPTGKILKCDIANWNCFMISQHVIEKVGFIDNKYAHAMGDYDYCFRMERKDLPIYVATKPVGYCERNSIENTYCDNSISRGKRFKLLFGRKGMPFYSMLRYQSKNYGIRGLAVLVYQYIFSIVCILMGKCID